LKIYRPTAVSAVWQVLRFRSGDNSAAGVRIGNRFPDAKPDRLLRFYKRKRIFDRFQQLVMENLPIIPLVTPNVLTGARQTLGIFRPALLDHNTLWKVEELYWHDPRPGQQK
jgi:hypothetical protein